MRVKGVALSSFLCFHPFLFLLFLYAFLLHCFLMLSPLFCYLLFSSLFFHFSFPFLLFLVYHFSSHPFLAWLPVLPLLSSLCSDLFSLFPSLVSFFSSHSFTVSLPLLHLLPSLSSLLDSLFQSCMYLVSHMFLPTRYKLKSSNSVASRSVKQTSAVPTTHCSQSPNKLALLLELNLCIYVTECHVTLAVVVACAVSR